MKAWILALLTCLATPAWAEWLPCPGTTSSTAGSAAVLAPGKDVCFRTATNTDPARVDARKCRGGVDVIHAADIAGVNYDALLTVWQCPASGSAASFTDCEKILPGGVDQSLTGDPVGNLDAVYGISPGWLAFNVTNSSLRTMEIRVICR